MTSDEAIEIAKRESKRRKWTWVGKGHARKGGWFTRFVYGARGPIWEVKSHNGIGCHITMVVDDQTGKVIEAAFIPR